jgi:hypothetical protein
MMLPKETWIIKEGKNIVNRAPAYEGKLLFPFYIAPVQARIYA